MNTTESFASLTADQVRSLIVEKFNQFKPTLDSYYDYAQQVTALNTEYHLKRLSETFQIPTNENVLVATLDSRETPKSLDNKLSEIVQAGVRINIVIHDRANAKFYLFT